MELLRVCRVLLNVGVREEVSIMLEYVSVIVYSFGLLGLLMVSDEV